MNITDKVIVITGASDGIGKSIALRLAQESVHLVLIGRDRDRLDAVRKSCEGLNVKGAYSYQCDISSSQEVKKTFETIISCCGGIDILINNAGIWQKLGQLDEIGDDVINSVVDINLKGLMYTTKNALPSMRTRDEAIILNISSKSGITAQAGQTIYTASKYGVRGFTEVLKVDLADTRILVAGLYQSGVNTGMFEKSGQDFPVENFSEPEDLADIVASILTLPPKIWLHDVRVEKC